MKNALVVGATGLVGKEIIRELINDDQYEKIIVLARRELSIAHPKLDTRLIEFNRLNEFFPDEKISACFCALGTTQKKSGREGMLRVDYEYVVQLASLCSEHDVPKFLVVSSQGANCSSSFFYLRTKGQMEEAVKKTGLPFIYFIRPSLITGEREEFRFAEEMGYYALKLISPLLVGNLSLMKPVSGLQIAQCMIDLSKSESPGNFTIESDFIQSY
jgi:uncharacterized protein YbjT (DUF2867 family)